VLPSILKMSQAMSSQALLGFRAYNRSRKNANVGLLLLCAYLVCCTFEWITTLYARTMSYSSQVRNCSSVGPRGALGGWSYYAVAIVYDFTTTTVCIIFLQTLKPTTSSVMSRVSRMMLVDGLWYFLVLGLTNLASVIFYRVTDIKFASTPKMVGELQTAAACLVYTVRWVMSQKLIIHLYEASRARRLESTLKTRSVTLTRTHTRTGRRGLVAISELDSQLDSKAISAIVLTVPSFSSDGESFEEEDDASRRRNDTESGLRAVEEENPDWEEIEAQQEAQVRLESGRPRRWVDDIWSEPAAADDDETRRSSR